MAVVRLVQDVPRPRLVLAGLDPRPPGLVPLGGDVGEQGLEHVAQVAHDTDVHGHVLVDLTGVDLDVDLLRVLRVGGELARDAVVEPHSEGEEEIRLLDGGVDEGLAVHAHHAEAERMAGREAAEPEQGQGDGRVRLLGVGLEGGGGARAHDAVAGQDEGTLRACDELRRLGQVFPADHGHVLLARQLDRLRPDELGLGLLCVLADVHEDGAGTAVARDREGLAHRVGDVLRLRHQHVVLGDGQGDPGDVRLLEGVAAQDLGRDLSGDEHGGDGVHHRGGDAGGQVRRPRTGGGDGHSDPAAGPCVPVRHVGRTLLVADQDVADGELQQGVIGGKDGATRISEHGVDALTHQAFPEDLRAGQVHIHPQKTKPPRSPSGVSVDLDLLLSRSQIPRAG
jgi:hypothetical protein